MDIYGITSTSVDVFYRYHKMVWVTPGVALILFILILVISGLTAWYMGNYAHFDVSTFHTFIAVLAGLGVFVTFMFYYSIVELQQQQQILITVQETARISDTVLNSLLEEMNQASIIIPRFVLSLNPLGTTGCTNSDSVTLNIEEDPINPQSCTEKLVLSYKIFNSWQDVIISSTFVAFDSLSYVTNFLQRANSGQLFQQWIPGRISFNAKTQSFGDLLFEYALAITDHTPQVYVATAQKLIADPRYKAIV